MTSLKKAIFKNTWYITCIFIACSVIANLSMVQVAKYVENIMYQLGNLEYKNFQKTVLSACILCILYIIFNFGYWFLYNCTVIKAEKLSLEYTYSHYLVKDLNFFSNKGTGDIAYSITSLSADVGSYYATFWSMLFVNIITLTILFLTIASFHFLFSLFVVLGIVLLIFFTSFISKKLADKTSMSESLAADINNTIIQSFQGISVIKVFRREAYFAQKYQKGLSLQKYRNDLIRDFWYSFYVVIYDAMTIIFPLIVLFVGFLSRERNLIFIGAVIAIYSLIGNMQEPIRNLASSVTYYKENASREEKLGKITEQNFCEEAAAEIQNIEVQIDHMELDGRTLLKNIQFQVHSGDVVSLQSSSGCGKSTLLKQILGFITCKGIQCYYNGTLQKEIPNTALFANISLVEQKPFLFSVSIKENILLGNDFGKEQLDEVIKVCALEEMVRQYGLEKEIDWNGGNVSGGEMQRITIARTLIRKPKFLLLDEITASLDAKTAGLIAKNIVAFTKKYNIGIIAVSHKDEFIPFSNKKIVFGQEN